MASSPSKRRWTRSSKASMENLEIDIDKLQIKSTKPRTIIKKKPDNKTKTTNKIAVKSTKAQPTNKLKSVEISSEEESGEPSEDSSEEESESEDEVPVTKSPRRNNSRANHKNVCKGSPKSIRLPNDLVGDTQHELVGRTEQLTELSTKLSSSLKSNTPLSLYVSGPPGTGKTATVMHTVHNLKSKYKFDHVTVNCVSFTTGTTMYKEVVEQLAVQHDTLNTFKTKSHKARLAAILCNHPRNVLIVLDEIDHLTKDVLYTAFGWPSLEGSRCMLIGIANSLDLTSRLLPKLRVGTVQPSLITYNPYTTEEVVAIVTNSMLESAITSQMEPKAIELCARKVSAITGDIRKAIGLCKLAVEKYSMQGKQDNDTTVTKVTVKHVLQSVNEVYGSHTQQKVARLPLHSKLVLAAAIRMSEKGDDMMMYKKLYTTYTRACALTKTAPLSEGELVEPIDVLDCEGILHVVTGKGKKGVSDARHVRMLMERSSAVNALNDEALLKILLEQL